MAVDIRIKIDGIEGERAKNKDEKAIDVLSYSWGASNSGTTHIGSGSGAGQANFQDVSFVKYVDTASCDLMNAVSSGKHIKEATLTVQKAGGDKPVPYLVYKLEDVIVTSFSTGGSGGEDLLTENVTLNFAKISVEYQKQNKDGTASKAGNYSWNIQEGEK